jgi:hypothetical protein
MLREAIPYSVILFWIKMMKPGFVFYMMLCRKLLHWAAYHSSNYDETFFAEVCSPLSAASNP